MDLATLNTIFTVLSEIVSFLSKYGPDMIADVENIVANLKMAWQSATSGVPLTADEQKKVDDALDQANQALQAAVEAQQSQT